MPESLDESMKARAEGRERGFEDRSLELRTAKFNCASLVVVLPRSIRCCRCSGQTT